MVRAIALLVLAACGGSSALPPPPPHTPAGSPEPATVCPTERTRAKEAREAVLEDASTARREAVARAVFAHAECERAQLDRAVVRAPTQTQLIEQIKGARLQYQNARNLYQEVANYEVLRWTVGARSRGGDLEVAFGDLLRAVRPPEELTDPNERTGFLSELGDLAQTFDASAVMAHMSALETAALVASLAAEDSEVGRWIEGSCRALARFGVSAERDAGMCGPR